MWKIFRYQFDLLLFTTVSKDVCVCIAIMNRYVVTSGTVIHCFWIFLAPYLSGVGSITPALNGLPLTKSKMLGWSIIFDGYCYYVLWTYDTAVFVRELRCLRPLSFPTEIQQFIPCFLLPVMQVFNALQNVNFGTAHTAHPLVCGVYPITDITLLIR